MTSEAYYRVNTGNPKDPNLSLRSGPNSSAEKLADIPNGRTFSAMKGQGGIWIYGTYKDNGKTYTGYVNSRYLQEDPSVAPTPAAAPSAASTQSMLRTIPDASQKPTVDEARDRIVNNGLKYYNEVAAGRMPLSDFRRIALQTNNYDLMRQFYDPTKQQALKPLTPEALTALKPYLPEGFRAGQSITPEVFKNHLDRFMSYGTDNFCAGSVSLFARNGVPGSLEHRVYVDDHLKTYKDANSLRGNDGSYMPKKGDLFFIKNTRGDRPGRSSIASHIGIVQEDYHGTGAVKVINPNSDGGQFRANVTMPMKSIAWFGDTGGYLKSKGLVADPANRNGPAVAAATPAAATTTAAQTSPPPAAQESRFSKLLNRLWGN
jgi:hypothetical protein